MTTNKPQDQSAGPTSPLWLCNGCHKIVCARVMRPDEACMLCGADAWIEIARSAQPGETQTYKSRKAGERVMQAIDGLTPWAQRQVLQWAMTQIRESINDAPF